MSETKVTTVVSENRDQDRSLVVVFLRGGADGLNLVAPVGDDDYFGARPTIGIGSRSAVMLNDFFGLNPLMDGLAPLYKEGMMSIVHCVGSEDQTRSHFEAQDIMDHGGNVAGGWLGRYLLATQPADGQRSPLSAVAIGSRLPENLRGAPAAAAMRSIKDFSLGEKTDEVRDLLGRLYAKSPIESLNAAGSSSVAVLKRIAELTSTDYAPSNSASYEDDEFSSGMREIAQLIKGRVGLEAAAIDLNGWDSHLTQPAVMDPEIKRLNAGLSAFCKDLGKAMERTTVVVMTEFGRRVRENSALGTDHGRGSVMFVLGGGHKGGTIHVDWPGPKAESLVGPGDLPVLTNYLNVLAPILKKISAEVDLSAVFPEFALAPLPLFG
ncbi:MAG: DUF1501 domain-containing protein [Verrucomicrobia bacterium]|nr:DUF1501 domain-containing protein [Verrucomicrobiota bacterium]